FSGCLHQRNPTPDQHRRSPVGVGAAGTLFLSTRTGHLAHSRHRPDEQGNCEATAYIAQHREIPAEIPVREIGGFHAKRSREISPRQGLAQPRNHGVMSGAWQTSPLLRISYVLLAGTA